jgi:hypothetical protein
VGCGLEDFFFSPVDSGFVDVEDLWCLDDFFSSVSGFVDAFVLEEDLVFESFNSFVSLDLDGFELDFRPELDFLQR